VRISAYDPKQTSRAFLGFRFLSERAAQWLELRTGSALLAQQPREFGRGGISALANEANILEMAHKVAAKIKDIPVADRRDLLSGSFAENVALDDPSHAFSLIVINEVAHWIPFVRHSLSKLMSRRGDRAGTLIRWKCIAAFPGLVSANEQAARESQDAPGGLPRGTGTNRKPAGERRSDAECDGDLA